MSESEVVTEGFGGEQGNAMMPLFVCLGQHEALQVADRGLRDGALCVLE